MVEFGMTRVRIGLSASPWQTQKQNSERFEGIEANLDEFRAYLYGNHESVTGYAKRTGTESVISTAHAECAVNQLINWCMCKKQWSRTGAQYLPSRETATISGRLDPYTGHYPAPADIAA
jgi:hypothetical protein